MKVNGYKILLFAVSEIGETRDAKRLPCASDLPDLVTCYRLHEAGGQIDPTISRAVTIKAKDIFDLPSVNLRHHWPCAVAKELGLLGEYADPLQVKKLVLEKIAGLTEAIDEWKGHGALRASPPTPANWKTVKLSDTSLFTLRIGRRVTKKAIHGKTTGVRVYSANVRKPFGFVDVANAGNLPNGGALWNMDATDFDCRHVETGETYWITDHCGEIKLLGPAIEPRYLARQILQAGLDYGFSRTFRPSLKVMGSLEIDLPIKPDGSFDTETMKEWADFSESMDAKASEIRDIAQ